MNYVENIRCPNCGSYGERHHLLDCNLVRTQCPECDYLMVTCGVTGKVVEAYAPGLSLEHFICRV
uniref:replication restart DNA helicase PriA n=1 Tax=Petrachloros mirabilis TaxID=2918835 RepID=UPI00137A32D7|nr:replication restart DNA helicase PriA [Petrachloros mirabilis]